MNDEIFKILNNYLKTICKKKFKIISNAKVPKILIEDTISFVSQEMINEIIPIRSTGGTYKDSPYYKQGFNTIVFLCIKN